MANKLIINPFAEVDIKDSKEYYDLEQDGLGDKFVEDVEGTLERIKQNPMQYPKVKMDMRKAGLKKFPYGIFYVFRDSVINILSVFNFSRNPSIWKRRYK